MRPPLRRSPGSRSRCGPRARRSTRSPAWSTRCTPSRTPIEVPGRLLDVVGTGGDRSTRSTSRRWPRSSRPEPERPSSSTATGRRRRSPAPPTCSRRSASASTCRPTRVAEVAVEAGITFCFAAALPPGDAARGGAAARARHRHHVQLPRSAGQPGPARGPGDRLRRRPAGAGDGGRLRPARRRRVGLPRRRRAGRAHHDHHVVGLGRPGRRGHRPQRSTRPSSGFARATAEDLRGGDAAYNAEVVRRLLAGEPGPVRDAVLLNAGAALAVYDAAGAPVAEALAAGCHPCRRGRRLRRCPGHPGPLGGGRLGLRPDRSALGAPRSVSPSRARKQPRGRAGSRPGTRCGSRCRARRGPC